MTKTAIITGGSRGLGRALAASLVGNGWFVVIDGRQPEALASAVGATGAQGVVGDVSDPDHRRALVAAVEQATGRLDLLVNNASTLGASPLPLLANLDRQILRRILEVNLVAPLALFQATRPLLVASGGVVLNLTSDAAVGGYPTWGGYGASKAALEQLSAVLAAEEPGLRVWWLDPGDMRTQMHQDAFPGEDISDRPEPESVVPAVRALLWSRPPSGRIRASELATGAGA